MPNDRPLTADELKRMFAAMDHAKDNEEAREHMWQPDFYMYPPPAIGEQQWLDDGTTRKTYEWTGTSWKLIKTEPTSGWKQDADHVDGYDRDNLGESPDY
jgi:hypothetical protein